MIGWAFRDHTTWQKHIFIHPELCTFRVWEPQKILSDFSAASPELCVIWNRLVQAAQCRYETTDQRSGLWAAARNYSLPCLSLHICVQTLPHPCNTSAPKLRGKKILSVSSAVTLTEAGMRTEVVWAQGQPCYHCAQHSNANWRGFIPSSPFILFLFFFLSFYFSIGCFSNLQVSWGECLVILNSIFATHILLYVDQSRRKE